MAAYYFKTEQLARGFIRAHGIDCSMYKTGYLCCGEICTPRAVQFEKGFAVQFGVCGGYLSEEQVQAVEGF